MLARRNNIGATAAIVGGLALALAIPATALADHDSDDLNHLVRVLQSARDEDDREDAAERLGEIAGPEAIPYLQHAARYDRDDDVREEAREAIEEIQERERERLERFRDRNGHGHGGWTCPHGCRGECDHHREYRRIDHWLSELANARRDSDRERAAERLGYIRDRRAIPALQRAAIIDRDDDVRDEARESIYKILGTRTPGIPAAAIPAYPRAVNALVRVMLLTPRDNAREEAAERLGNIGHPAANAALLHAAIFDRDDDVRDEARESLLRIRHGDYDARDRFGWHRCSEACERHPASCPHSDKWHYRDHRCDDNCKRHPAACPMSDRWQHRNHQCNDACSHSSRCPYSDYRPGRGNKDRHDAGRRIPRDRDYDRDRDRDRDRRDRDRRRSDSGGFEIQIGGATFDLGDILRR